MERIEIREQRHVGTAVCTGLIGVIVGALLMESNAAIGIGVILVGIAAGAMTLWAERRRIIYAPDGITVGRNRKYAWEDVIQVGILPSGESPHERMLILTLKGGLPRNEGESFQTWIGKNRRLGTTRRLLCQRHRPDLEAMILRCQGPLDFNSWM